MADIYNTTDNLYWVFTKYGMDRLASLSKDDKLFLYKAGVGCYNWYQDELKILGDAGYSEGAFKKYFTDSDTKALGALVTDGKVAINTKSLVSDSNNNAVAVELNITVPETLANFDLREVGIYETIDNVDHLFAVCTMQPIPKPSTDTNHYNAIQLKAVFYSKALTGAYEQIVLDPNNNFATVDELNTFEENLLFVEANLAEQISNNSRIIGYDRPQQLYEQIVNDKVKYSNFAVSTTYANMLNIAELNDISSFWVFQANNDVTSAIAIPDLSSRGINLATDKLSTLYETGYEGLAPWLNFEYLSKSNSGNYFTLEEDIDFDFVTTKDGKVSDSPFTLMFIGAQNTNEHECTIIAKDNSAQNNDTQPAFCISVTTDRRLKIRLYQNRANYVDYITGENSVPEAGTFYVATITYSPVINEVDNILIPRFTVMIDGKVMTGDIVRTGNYQGMTKTALPLASRVHTLNGYTNYIDSKMCLISLIKKELSPDYIRATTYNMMALIGVNPCLIQ